jgi:hypothetical protein
MTKYRHSQVGYVIIYSLSAMALIVLLSSTAVSHFSSGLALAAILGAVVAVFYRLTIEMDDVYLRAKFGPGLTLRRIKLADIASCQPIRIRWTYGWGIHLTPYGWLYNVSGWDAVAITLHNGRRVSLGTDQPNELCEAIRRLASTR